jgi:hypothetical protein
MLLIVSQRLERISEWILQKYFGKIYKKLKFNKIQEISIFYDSLYILEERKKEKIIKSLYFNKDEGTILKVKNNSIEVKRGLNPSFSIFYFSGESLIISDNFRAIWLLIKEIEERATLSSLFETFYLRHLPIDKTLIYEIRRLPPFTEVKFKKINKRWILTYTNEFQLFSNNNLNNLYNNLYNLSEAINFFENSLNEFFKKLFSIKKDKEVPILLSGGIDSTLLLAIAKSYIEKYQKEREIVAYTVPLKIDKYYSRLVCEELKIENRILEWHENSSFLIQQFKNFVLTHGYPIYHNGFFQLAFKQIPKQLIFWNQGIEDITLGREELRIIHNLTKFDFLNPFADVVYTRKGLSVIKNFLKEKDVVRLFLSLKSLVPLKKITPAELIFKSHEVRTLRISLAKKVGLLFLLNGFYSDSLNLDKNLISPVVFSTFLHRTISLPEEFLVRGRYDRFIERALLSKLGIPQEIYLKKERSTWEEQTTSWFLKMEKYHYKNISLLFELEIFPKDLKEHFLSKIYQPEVFHPKIKYVIFLSSLGELMKSFLENKNFEVTQREFSGRIL